MLSKITFAACLVSAAVARCESPELVHDFDAAAYMGTWFQVQKSSGLFYVSDDAECTQAIYSNLDAQKGTFDVYNSYQPAGSNQRKEV
mmetsp:Transcript_17068/g.12133  ORF Transcript_17068/g.12133 Transcript_17068/m.12133 type:complete len:88 (+) Transcript_17068:32-295(+)